MRKGQGEVEKRAVVGAKFNMLTIEKREADRVLCRCECGNTKDVWIYNLIGNQVKSCGCYRGIKNKLNSKRDGFAKTHLYWSWIGMVNRCHTPGGRDYDFYGAKGVFVCSYLKATPKNLFDLIGPRLSGTSIDRYPIHNGNYTCGQCEECAANGWKKNVRWATYKEQVLNRGEYNHRLTILGETLTISQWAERTGIGGMTLLNRVENNWPEQELLSPPNTRRMEKRKATRKDAEKLTAFGRTLPLPEWGKLHNIYVNTILRRLAKGWTPEEALTTPSRKKQRTPGRVY
jgi:hypothetical protein